MPQSYEFQIGGTHYRQTTIPALAAIGIAAKFGTILKHLPGMVRTMNEMRAEIAAAAQQGEDRSLVEVAMQSDLSVLGPFGEAIADIPDEHRDRMIAQILKVTFRQSGPGFLPTWDNARGAPVEDMGPIEVMRVLFETYKAQFAPFLSAPASYTNAVAGADPSNTTR